MVQGKQAKRACVPLLRRIRHFTRLLSFCISHFCSTPAAACIPNLSQDPWSHFLSRHLRFLWSLLRNILNFFAVLSHSKYIISLLHKASFIRIQVSALRGFLRERGQEDARGNVPNDGATYSAVKCNELPKILTQLTNDVET